MRKWIYPVTILAAVLCLNIATSAEAASPETSIKKKRKVRKRIPRRKAVTRASRSNLLKNWDNSGWRVAPKVGFSIFGLTGIDLNDGEEQVGKLGFSGGAAVEYKTSGIWAFETGLFAVNTGAEYEFDDVSRITGDISISSWYLQIPAVAKLYAIQDADFDLYFRGGLALGILIDSEAEGSLTDRTTGESTGDFLISLEDNYNTFDLLGSTGMGVNWAVSSSVRLNLDLGLSLSILDIVQGSGGNTIRNFGFTTLFGAQFLFN